MSLIANVIVHRQRSGNWAGTIPGVVQSPKQFTGIHYDHRNVLSLTLEDYDNSRLKKSVRHKWRRSIRVAEAALSAPDSLRPPKANAYANLSESGWKPWMRERHIVYRTPHHAYFRLPERRPPGPTAAATR
jgi:hypothetical protein